MDQSRSNTMRKVRSPRCGVPYRTIGGGMDLNLIKEKEDKPLSSRVGIYRIFKQMKQQETKRIRASYLEYLNTFIKAEDRRYLPSERVALRLIPLKSRVGQVVLSPSKFRQSHISPLGTYFRFDQQHIANDPLTKALAEREKLNATKTVSTIVFVSTRDSKGFSVSGYIDLEQSTRNFMTGGNRSHPWSDIFAGNRRLLPNCQDLSFIAWKNGRVCYNESDNYKVIPDSAKGLCFLFKGDGSLLCIEKYITEDHPSCIYIESPKHGSAVIYDHRIRRKM